MHKLLLFCFLFLAVSLKPPVKVVKKGSTAKKTYSIQLDSSKVNVRSFNAVAMNKYRNNPQFSYTENAKEMSWWRKFWAWVWEMIQKLFGGESRQSSAPSMPYMKYIFGLIAIALLVFVVVKMVGLNLANIFNRDPKDIAIPYSESLESIHQITFDEEIEKALSQRNYRLAIRLLYLSTLKQLNDAQLIHWQMEKTNSAYINELTDAGQRQSFGILTRQFEYVWYGDFPVDGRSFQNINTLFHDFKTMLK